MITFIDVNRWKYDPSRGLHENCKTPWVSDDQILQYLVKQANKDADSSPLELAVVPPRKRGPIRKASSNSAATLKTVLQKKTAKPRVQKNANIKSVHQILRWKKKNLTPVTQLAS